MNTNNTTNDIRGRQLALPLDMDNKMLNEGVDIENIKKRIKAILDGLSNEALHEETKKLAFIWKDIYNKGPEGQYLEARRHIIRRKINGLKNLLIKIVHNDKNGLNTLQSRFKSDINGILNNDRKLDNNDAQDLKDITHQKRVVIKVIDDINKLIKVIDERKDYGNNILDEQRDKIIKDLTEAFNINNNQNNSKEEDKTNDTTKTDDTIKEGEIVDDTTATENKDGNTDNTVDGEIVEEPKNGEIEDNIDDNIEKEHKEITIIDGNNKEIYRDNNISPKSLYDIFEIWHRADSNKDRKHEVEPRQVLYTLFHAKFIDIMRDILQQKIDDGTISKDEIDEYLNKLKDEIKKFREENPNRNFEDFIKILFNNSDSKYSEIMNEINQEIKAKLQELFDTLNNNENKVYKIPYNLDVANNKGEKLKELDMDLTKIDTPYNNIINDIIDDISKNFDLYRPLIKLKEAKKPVKPEETDPLDPPPVEPDKIDPPLVKPEETEPPEPPVIPDLPTQVEKIHIIDVSPIVEEYANRVADRQMRRQLHGGDAKNAFTRFFNKVKYRLGESGYRQKYYEQARNSIISNHSLMAEISRGITSVTSSSKNIDIDILNSVLKEYSQNIVHNDEKGNLDNVKQDQVKEVMKEFMNVMLVNNIDANNFDIAFAYFMDRLRGKKFNRNIDADLRRIIDDINIRDIKLSDDEFSAISMIDANKSPSRRLESQGLMYASNMKKLYESLLHTDGEKLKEKINKSFDKAIIAIGTKTAYLNNKMPDITRPDQTNDSRWRKWGQKLIRSIQKVPILRTLAAPAVVGFLSSAITSSVLRNTSILVGGTVLTATTMGTPVLLPLAASIVAGGTLGAMRKRKEVTRDVGTYAKESAIGSTSINDITKNYEHVINDALGTDCQRVYLNSIDVNNLSDNDALKYFAMLNVGYKENFDFFIGDINSDKEFGAQLSDFKSKLYILLRTRNIIDDNNNVINNNDDYDRYVIQYSEAVDRVRKSIKKERWKQTYKSAVISGLVGGAGGIVSSEVGAYLSNKGIFTFGGVDPSKHHVKGILSGRAWGADTTQVIETTNSAVGAESITKEVVKDINTKEGWIEWLQKIKGGEIDKQKIIGFVDQGSAPGKRLWQDVASPDHGDLLQKDIAVANGTELAMRMSQVDDGVVVDMTRALNENLHGIKLPADVEGKTINELLKQGYKMVLNLSPRDIELQHIPLQYEMVNGKVTLPKDIAEMFIGEFNKKGIPEIHGLVRASLVDPSGNLIELAARHGTQLPNITETITETVKDSVAQNTPNTEYFVPFGVPFDMRRPVQFGKPDQDIQKEQNKDGDLYKLDEYEDDNNKKDTKMKKGPDGAGDDLYRSKDNLDNDPPKSKTKTEAKAKEYVLMPVEGDVEEQNTIFLQSNPNFLKDGKINTDELRRYDNVEIDIKDTALKEKNKIQIDDEIFNINSLDVKFGIYIDEDRFVCIYNDKFIICDIEKQKKIIDNIINEWKDKIIKDNDKEIEKLLNDMALKVSKIKDEYRFDTPPKHIVYLDKVLQDAISEIKKQKSKK